MKSKHPEQNEKSMTERGMEHSTEGKVDKVKGRLKDAAGGLTGDGRLQAEGKVDQLKGNAKDAIGKVERKLGENDSRYDEP
jgi:uncharacterized protein YjbJ (UPF0337 family)